jgi:hypothetical protein
MNPVTPTPSNLVKLLLDEDSLACLHSRPFPKRLREPSRKWVIVLLDRVREFCEGDYVSSLSLWLDVHYFALSHL